MVERVDIQQFVAVKEKKKAFKVRWACSLFYVMLKGGMGDTEELLAN
jgi:hypothetical protein